MAVGGHASRRPTDGQLAQRGTATVKPAAKANGPPFAVGLRVITFTDSSRRIELPGGGTEPRILRTYIRYPALGSPSRTDVLDAPAARTSGPFPLVIFGHGFAHTPALYARLLQSWARPATW